MLTIENGSVIQNNHAGDAGGGVETDGQGKVFINTGTQILGNTCVNQGAGVWLDNIGQVSANLTMDSVTVTNNVAFNGPTGGIGNAGSGAVSINLCIVSQNFSGTTGGGFGDENMLGNLTITNSQFLSNYAGTNGGGIQAGGDEYDDLDQQHANRGAMLPKAIRRMAPAVGADSSSPVAPPP